MMSQLKKIEESVNFIKSQVAEQAFVGIILGSGLGNLANTIQVEAAIPYHEIPHFPVSTVEGHSGKLLFGELGGKKVWVMQGRFHFYEGYHPSEVTYPVRVLKFLGVSTLLLSNAAGAVNPSYEIGDLMIIKDHISFFTPNPLIGKNESEIGTRFPDMSEPYSKKLIAQVKTIAQENQILVHEGVYLAVTGPTFETRAEYQLIHILGADVVGMSTVQENIIARHAGMDVFAISVVTDIGIREEENAITHQEVLEAANAAEPKLTLLITELLKNLSF